MTVNLLKTKTCVLNKTFDLDNFSVPILFGNKPIEKCDEYNILKNATNITISKLIFQHGVTGSKAIMQET